MEQQILNLFINNIPQFVFWKDRESVYLGCNANFASYAGFDTPAAVVGKTDYDMPWSREEADFFRKIDQEVMSSGQPQLNFEEPQTLADNSTRWLSTSKVPLLDDQKNVIGILGWYIDITDYKLMKVEIDEKNQALLEYSLQLEKSKKTLELVNFDLEKFTYAVSHDLKAPIKTIIGFAQLIEDTQKENPNQDIHQYLDFIISSGKRMNSLVEDILTYARTGADDTVSEEIEIAALVSKKLLDLEQLIDSKSAMVELHLDACRLNCHPHLLGVVFYNLISNGLKYNKAQNPRVICEAVESDTEWTFSVSDNGMGIDPTYRDRVFEPFKRLVGGEFEGSGIGLSICRRIVDIHKGRIWIEDNVPCGTKFLFTVSKSLSKP